MKESLTRIREILARHYGSGMDNDVSFQLKKLEAIVNSPPGNKSEVERRASASEQLMNLMDAMHESGFLDEIE